MLYATGVGSVSGFDLSIFGPLRRHAGATWHDAEQLQLVEGNGNDAVRPLSSRHLLLEVDLNAGDLNCAASGESHEKVLMLTATSDGLLGAVASWFEIQMPSGEVVDLGPSHAPLRPVNSRARRQRLHYLPVGRSVKAGEAVNLSLRLTDSSLDVEVETPVAASPDPHPPSLPSYHFPMLADETRNAAFDRSLTAAIAKLTTSLGKPPTVLDIGGGSGLLSMMAARA